MRDVPAEKKNALTGIFRQTGAPSVRFSGTGGLNVIILEDAYGELFLVAVNLVFLDSDTLQL